MPLEIVTAREIELIRKQMLDEYRNITRSLGFAVQTNGEIVFRPIKKAYQAVPDKAEMKVYSGGFTVSRRLKMQCGNWLTAVSARLIMRLVG